jgi:heme/copper-type cytochrome/quinol oxidase subunit 2
MRIVRFATGAATILVLAAAYFSVRYFMATESVAAPQSVAYRLDLNGPDKGVEAPTLHVREGDRVALTVTSPNSGELFIHGLDRGTRLTPGLETNVAFTAAHAGRYFIHFHGADHSHTEVGVVEVAPR